MTDGKGRDKTICRMEREDRFLAVRPYLHRHVIIRASQTRSPRRAEHFTGIVEAVAWAVLGGTDTLVLTPTGPTGYGLPTLSIELTRILTIFPWMEMTDEHADDRPA